MFHQLLFNFIYFLFPILQYVKQMLSIQLQAVNNVTESSQNGIVFALIIILLMLGGIIFLILENYKLRKRNKNQFAVRQRNISRKKEEVEKEQKKKSEDLLLNILPASIAEQLGNYGKSAPRSHEMVTVLFTDFKGFTTIAEKLPPKHLIAELDLCFRKFDEIMGIYGLEKIKTIGDAYMCAGGIPIDNTTNPVDIITAALQIQKFMSDLSVEKIAKGEDPWELRIGIHTGPIVAGIVGAKKFSYDIWGDTVNTASRMESSGEGGRINISGTTYSMVEKYFDCTFRGKIKAKNKGEIDMYFLDGIKPELSIDGLGVEPNTEFKRMLAESPYTEMNYKKVGQYILKLLSEQLPDDLYYHSIHHTINVCSAAERIGKAEGMNEEDLCILKTAALFHDAGFIRKYEKNEPIGCIIARETLPQYGYNADQIEKITSLIMATQIPQRPQNMMEKIICDADLDYLGKKDFHDISDTLKKELIFFGKIVGKDWDELQLQFLEVHTYFTPTSIKLREAKKQEHIAQIRERLAAANKSKVATID